MTKTWKTTVTAFAVPRRGSSWLMVRHQRLGVTRWELPGGHVDAAETLEETAARETTEETGVAVEVGCLVASCVHEWLERRQRNLICFFEATAIGDAVPVVPSDELDVLEAAWVNPLEVHPISPFLGPLIDLLRTGKPDVPIHFRMTHRMKPEGLWEPAPVAE